MNKPRRAQQPSLESFFDFLEKLCIFGLNNKRAFFRPVYRIGDQTMQTESVKQKAHQLLDKLPDSASWEDVMYRIYVRQAIEAGIKDSDQGRTTDVREVRKRFGLT
jgi:hypothetical protein